MFNARQSKGESISCGYKIDALQTDVMETARRICKPEGILGAIGLTNHLEETCFIQVLTNELIQTIVRCRGESTSCPEQFKSYRKKKALLSH